MNDAIGISFTPSNEYADWLRQDRNIVDRRGYGATPGDTWHLGYRSYDIVDPFARSREQEERGPITHPAWRAMVDKARKDSERFDHMWAIRDAAELITDDEFDLWFNTITKG